MFREENFKYSPLSVFENTLQSLARKLCREVPELGVSPDSRNNNA